MLMALNPLAGKSPTPEMLVDVPRLVTSYYTEKPDPAVAAQRVSFGTTGHRGSSFDGSFNEDHILAITQAICEYRAANGVDGPLFLAKDTHALSEPAFASALEVLAANDVEVMVDETLGYTPTPALSHAMLAYNRGRASGSGRRHRDHALAQSARTMAASNTTRPTAGPPIPAPPRPIQDRANQILARRTARRAPRDLARRRWPPPPRTATITSRPM